MNIYVCIKHVPDSAATIDIIDGNRIDEDVTFLLNPYDEHAVTEAAGLKKYFSDAEVVAVCIGKKTAETTVRSALAMGVDRGVLVVTASSQESMATARALKAAIGNDGDPAIILTGREAIDSEGRQTMFRLAAEFGFPVATDVVSLTIVDDKARVACETAGGGKGYLRTDSSMRCRGW